MWPLLWPSPLLPPKVEVGRMRKGERKKGGERADQQPTMMTFFNKKNETGVAVVPPADAPAAEV